MDQGSTKKRSAVHNFVPTVTKFWVMWEGLSLPHDTKFGNCRGEIVDRRVIFIWSLIHGSSWSGLIRGPLLHSLGVRLIDCPSVSKLYLDDIITKSTTTKQNEPIYIATNSCDVLCDQILKSIFSSKSKVNFKLKALNYCLAVSFPSLLFSQAYWLQCFWANHDFSVKTEHYQDTYQNWHYRWGFHS